jgi:hypothetical protein
VLAEVVRVDVATDIEVIFEIGGDVDPDDFRKH